ncbi:MAG: hypothetical protein COB58_09900 [Thalassobium sp.]|nr:MAG: hypothetical protein COB43_11800 [Oceanospirillales bacterium]PHQ85069.1 MAG: hypothetical protein COB58_09900 [Thalassobium sp.]
MKNIIGISLLFVASTFASSAYATKVLQRTIEQVNVADDDAGNPQLIIKINGGLQSSSCTDKTAFIRPLNDEIGKQLMAVSLTAISTGALVDIVGIGNCGSWDVETFKEIRLYK